MLECGKIFSIKYILLESFSMKSYTDIMPLFVRTHKQAPAGGGIFRSLYIKPGKGRKRISSSVLQGYSQWPISIYAATLLNLPYTSQTIF
jgi:hypothetical protein